MVSVEYSALDEQLSEMVAFELELDTPSFNSKSCPTSLANPSLVDFYLQYLGIYLIKCDLINAKFLYKRMPSHIKEDQSIKCLWDLGRLLWKNDIKLFFTSVSQIFSDPKHSDILVQMVRQIRDKQIDQITHLVTQAYSCVSIDFLCNYLCISSEDISKHFLSKSWQISTDGRFISRPGNFVEEQSKTLGLENETANNEIMSKLTEFMCFMESH
ncbi:unnamed protein product [Trichobilharzia szidati]|nr:unnamed protein product [Trichobilharzia szidati]CAH8833692.1 unnamed protein product [Trichobilharzia szidati]